MPGINDAPPELAAAIRQFWDEDQWDNAAGIAFLESGFNAYADRNTTSAAAPCGTNIGNVGGTVIVSEHSVGYFQINVCNFPTWEWRRLWNAEQNAGTAHMLYAQSSSWAPWYYSAKALGLLTS